MSTGRPSCGRAPSPSWVRTMPSTEQLARAQEFVHAARSAWVVWVAK